MSVTPKIDLSNFEKLELFHGTLDNAKVSYYGGVRLVIASDGTPYAMNHGSAHPKYLNNRDERATWARALGLKPSDVENFVRREKRRERAEELEEEIKRAYGLLNQYAGIVKALKAKGDLA